MIIELIGWIGVIFVLLAYFLVTIKKVASTSKTFHLLNLFGALGRFKFKKVCPYMVIWPLLIF